MGRCRLWRRKRSECKTALGGGGLADESGPEAGSLVRSEVKGQPEVRRWGARSSVGMRATTWF